MAAPHLVADKEVRSHVSQQLQQLRPEGADYLERRQIESQLGASLAHNTSSRQLTASWQGCAAPT